MKILCLSYLEPIDRAILATIDSSSVQFVRAMKSNCSVRQVYNHWFQKQILPNAIDQLKCVESQEPEAKLVELADDYDVLLTCDAPLLTKSFCETFPLPIINIHFGISRFYRGVDSIFWAMNSGDTAHIGLTFHYVDSGIDTGKVVMECYPRLVSGDSEKVLWRKFIDAAQRYLPAVLESVVVGKCAGRQVDERGRLFQKKQRTILKEVWFRLREKKMITTNSEEKIVWFKS